MKIAIMGAGAYGTALGNILTENGHMVKYYDPFVLETTLNEALDGAEMVLEVVPSMALVDTLKQLPKDKPLVVATKGILSDEIFNGFKKVMVLSGPGFADEIKARKETCLTLTDKTLEGLFKADYMRFDYTTDVKGVLMCGALKNVYAILAGYLGLLPGGEDYELFISEVLEEMRTLLSANGAQPQTVDLYCGIGDLRLTCDTPSRNYQYGLNLRDGGALPNNTTVEGLTALQSIRDGAIKVPSKLDRLEQITRIVWG